jgi:hypothetical protein
LETKIKANHLFDLMVEAPSEQVDSLAEALFGVAVPA